MLDRPAASVAPLQAGRSGAIVPVILSGGSGSRLWPVSRASFPKQLWPLISDRTMLQETALRGVGAGFAPPVIVCNQEHRFLIAEQLREAGIDGARIVLEPVGRNSAPALAAAALLVAETTPDAVLWMMAADSAIAGRTRWRSGGDGGRGGTRRPDRHVRHEADPGRDRLRLHRGGRAARGPAGVHALAAFVEKPDAAGRATLAGSGRHLWNSGMFVFTAGRCWTRCRRMRPTCWSAVRRAVEGRRPTSTSSVWSRMRSRPRPTSASTMRWPSAPRGRRWCRPISAGPTSAAGTRCGTSARRTLPATCRSATCSWSTPPTATSAPTASSPP